MSVPNVLFSIGYAPNNETLSRLRTVKAKYITERKFYSCQQTDDFLKYVNKGISAGDFLGYAGNPEKSSGLFGVSGLLTAKQIKELRQMLRVTDSNIWHAVISFTEEFGEKYMTSYEDAYELLRTELPKFFKNIGIAEDNVVWYAGLHENTDNQHIHLGFFEKEQRYVTALGKKRFRFGTIGEDAMDKFRVAIEERLTDASFDLKRSRRNLTATATDTLFHLNGLNSEERDLKRKLLTLYLALPASGRVSYNSKNMDGLRKQVDALVTYIIRVNPNLRNAFKAFCYELERFDTNRKRICQEQKITDIEKYLVADKYVKDIYRRLGDKVIKATLAVKRECEFEKKLYKNEQAKKRLESESRLYLLTRTSRITADVNEEAMNCFEEYRRRLARAEYNRLVEEGEIESE